MIQRYRWTPDCMVRDEHGDDVLYSDHAPVAEERDRLKAERDGQAGLYRGAVKVLHALANDDRLALGTVNEDYQADVDEIIVERDRLRAEVERLEGEYIKARKAKKSWRAQCQVMAARGDEQSTELSALRELAAAAAELEAVLCNGRFETEVPGEFARFAQARANNRAALARWREATGG